MKTPASARLETSFARRVVALALTIGGAAVELFAAETNAHRTPPPLEPIFRLRELDGKHRFVTRDEPRFDQLKARLDTLFRAVVTNEWPGGWVPIFAVDKAHGVELRRRSLAGEENTSEPLFFGLPPADEVDAGRIAGRWECVATRGSDSRKHLVWQLAVEAGRISGRFDQNTEYRVAFITGGTFRSNRFDLVVEYLQDKYLLTGDWRNGRLAGDWRRADEEERGAWEAVREPGPPTPAGAVPLYEWRRASDNARHYALEEERMAVGWERAPRPLCRVWRAADEPSKGLKPSPSIP
jgi:hypothetical protein